MYIIKFLYTTFLLPPGILIFLLAIYSVYLYRKKNRAYRGTAVFVLMLYLVSIPLVSDYFLNKLETKHSFTGTLKGDVIVILCGGAVGDTPGLNGTGTLSSFSASRLLSGAELYNKLHVPIIISGGQVYSFSGNESEISRRILLNLGVKDADIIIENKSLNTDQNALYSSKLLKDRGFTEPILVTSAFHMERSVLLFERNNIEVLPYPCDYRTNMHKSLTTHHFIPNSGSLNDLSSALKEYIAIFQIKVLPKISFAVVSVTTNK